MSDTNGFELLCSFRKNILNNEDYNNMDVIKNSDWIIDLGPEGGDKGGQVIATGTPKQVAANPKSYTGQYLKKLFVN
jgi:excinuclease UvrABC ATPase subunit